jgi:membrane fusion protein (multidrug efflux system)
MGQGLTSGEVRNMFTKRPLRVAGWVLGLLLAVGAGFAVPYEDRASGAFEVRSAARAELRAPTAGFLRAVRVREGRDVAAGAEVARLEVPDLASRTAQARAAVREAEARVRLARAGARAPAADATTEVKLARADRELAAAQLSRLREELAYLESLRDKQSVRSPVAGVMVTPHLGEKVGQFLREGDLIGTVEDCGDLLVEVRLPEGEVERVRPGQAVECKARALPFATLRGTVEAVAPVAVPGKDGAPGTVTVYCRLVGVPASVRPAMTGDARIACGRRPAAAVLARRVLRYVRTEVWW